MYIFILIYIHKYTYTHTHTHKQHVRIHQAHINTHTQTGSHVAVTTTYTVCLSTRMSGPTKWQRTQYIHTYRCRSTRALAKHTAPHISPANISPATFPNKRARSVRVCLQKRCYHLCPSLILCSIMQRQHVFLRKRRQRATSACHTGRQAGVLLPSILVVQYDHICMYVGSTHDCTMWWRTRHTHMYVIHMIAHMHSLNTQRPAPTPQRTQSAVLAALGYACSSATTTSGPALFFTA